MLPGKSWKVEFILRSREPKSIKRIDEIDLAAIHMRQYPEETENMMTASVLKAGKSAVKQALQRGC